MRFALYIDGTNMDLFSDETIVLSRQVKDITQLDAQVSDFTQSFTIPATSRNNKVFNHWYNVDVINGFNAHKKVDARIEVDGLSVFNGIIELKNVSFSGYEPKAYEVVFYGDTKKLSTKLSDKLLEDIDWSDYNHVRSAVKITNSWSGTLLSGKILYPVLGLEKAFNYNANSTTLANNIAKSATDVEVTDLRPAILLTEMVKTIIENEGYTTSGDFYTDTYFDDLYIMPSAYAGPLNRVTLTPLVTATRFQNATLGTANTYKAFSQWSETQDNTNSFNHTSGVFTVATAGDYDLRTKTNIAVLNSGATLDVTLFKNNTALTGVYTTSYSSTGSKTQTYSLIGLASGDEIEVRYRSSDSGAQVSDLEFKVTDGPDTPSDMSVNMGEVMPKVKASDFLNQVCKTFNLVLIPISDTQIDVEPLQSWLDSGTTRDYTKYVDMENIKHDKIDVPKRLSFKHSKSDDFVNKAFISNNQREFGAVSTEPSIDFGNGELKVESPFTVFPQAYLNKLNSNGAFSANSNIQIYHALDNDLNPLNTPFLMFYYCGLKSSDTWYFNTSSKTTFPIISPFSAEPCTSSSNSLAYSLESCLNGDAPTNTILEKWWLKYISRTYSTTSRKVIMKMVLPVGEWLKLELNDTINIRGYYYKIDSIKYNLLTQESQVTLMTYPDVDILDVQSSSGNDFTIGTLEAKSSGNTFVGFGGSQTTIANIIRINDTASTDAPNQQDVQLVLQNKVVVDVTEEQDLGGGGTETP